MAPRAVVVDDSNFMRVVIADLLEENGFDVVARAGNGCEAIEAVTTHEPDVVTMDVEMPVLDGVAAVEEIMATRPTPILMLSAHTDEGTDVTFDALDEGAVDFFTKPGGELSVGMARFEDQLVAKVRSVASATVSADGVSADAGSTPGVPDAAFRENATLVVGASTGGPSVVEDVLTSLPGGADLRVLVVQHMPPEFTARYAARLDGDTGFDVAEATDGDRVGAGEAVVAPGDYHLVVESHRRGRVRVGLTQTPPLHGVRPAIDVTMESAAGTVDDPLVGVLLTGMGEDGAAGVEAIRAAGGTVIVQDEATSAVFGMPKRAIETGCVDAVLPAGDIPGAVTETLTGANS